jgi:hypothetical protein
MKPDPGRIVPVGVLAAVAVGGWLACALWPRLLAALGLMDYNRWYLDSQAVLAAVDAVRHGLDPYAANPLDPLFRNHKYSDWWFALRWLGLTGEDNFAVGTAWIALFAVAVGSTVRPRTLREAGWLALLLVSPPVLLAVNRANNDLVIFAVLAATGAAAAGTSTVRQVLAVGLLSLATGLKFYPVVAALGFLWVRPLPRMPALLLFALLAAGLTLAGVWPQVVHGQFPIPSGLHLLGAPLLGRDLGLTDAGARVAALLILTAGAVALTGSRCTVGLAEAGEARERLTAVMGGLVLVACFVAGLSYSYRWIFALGLALWLWRQAHQPSPSARIRVTRWLGVALLIFCFWSDGLFCLAVNLRPAPLSQDRIDGMLVAWRLWTQPWHWLLMTLLSGWLLEGAIASVRSWWEQRRAI